MSDLSIQGEVVVNSEKAESAFDRVGDKASQMANEVATSAGKAGQAVDKIGDGAGASADKFTRAESRISASIKRATNELELLGKTASQRLEFNIADKGLDAAKFEPALKKLREIEAQALQAQRAATGSLDKMGISAAQTAAALRGVPAQFTDIVTSLQGGQAPLTVFLQQGGQLKDMFGGAGNAARALGGYVVGLINPFTLAAAAVGGLAFAYNQGSKEADAYRAALVTTGNAAGTNAAQLKSYAQEISSVVGTQGKAAEALSALAATGKVGAENLRDAAQAAVAYERATGQAASKTAEQFAALRNEPLSAVLKLNDGMNFLTESTYRQIKSLEEQGKTAEAANVAQRAFADTLSGRAGEMERNLGAVERGWLAVKDAAKGAWDAILNVGRSATNVDQLAEVRKQIAQRENQLANGGFGTNEGGAAFGRPSQAATERLRAELQGLQAKAAALEGVAYATKVAADEERKRGESVKASAAFDKAGEKFLTDKARMERELAAARVQGAEAGRSQAEIEKRLGEIRASYAKKGGGGVAAENKELRDQQRIFAELAGVSSTYYAELANYQKQRAAGVATEAQYTAAVEKLIQKQPFAVALAKEEAEAAKVLTKAHQEAAAERLKIAQSMEKSADAFMAQNDALREEIELIGLSTEQQTLVLQQRNEVIILTKEATLAELERQSAITGTQTRVEIALAAEIAALKERNKLLGAKAGKNAALDLEKANAEAAKKAQEDWERTSEQINSTLTDALMRGFESGKDFAKNLRDTVVNMFKTMVLRPVISAVVNPVAGAITGALGLAGTANAATGGAAAAGGAGNLLTAASLAGNSSFMMGLSGAWGAGGGLMSTLNAGASLLQTGTLSSITSGLGTIAGALGPIALGIALLSSLIKKSTPHTGGIAGYSEASGMSTGASVGLAFGIDERHYTKAGEDVAGGVSKAIVQMLDQTASTFGKQAGYSAASAFADDSSKDGAWGALRIKLGEQILLDWADTAVRDANVPREFADGEAGSKEYLAAVAKSARDALVQAIGDVEWANDMLTALGESPTLEGLAVTVQQINAAQAAFDALGKNIVGFGALTDGAISQLVKASGGIEGLVSAASTYYENFYSDAEKTANVTRDITATLADVGLEMPKTREEFRALVEAQMALGEAGAPAVAALLRVNSAFFSTTERLTGLTNETKQLEIELLRASGKTAEADALLRKLATEGYSAAELAAYDYNETLKKQIQTYKDGVDSPSTSSSQGGAVFGGTGGGEYKEVEAVADAWKDLLASIVESTLAAQTELSRLGMTSYERALAEIQDNAQARLKELLGGGYMSDTMQTRDSNVRGLARWEGLKASYTELEASGVMLRQGWQEEIDATIAALKNSIAGLNEELAKMPPEIQDLIAAETALLEARNALQAGEIVGNLQTEIERLNFTPLEKELAGISDRAEDYIKSLRDLGQGTDENIAAVQAWEEAMRAAAQSGGTAAANISQKFEDAYKSQLGRAADTAGLEYWIGVVESGTMTLETALEAFAEGATGEKLNRRILELTDAEGYLAQMRENELSLLSETNRPLQERIWLLEDEKRIAEERNGLMTSLYQALGNTGALRADQLSKLDPSNRGLQEQVWAIEDAKAALQKALQAEVDSATAAQQAAQERVGTLQSIFDTLKSNVDSLYDSVEATKAWGAAQANAFIDNALGNARATGYMPEADELGNAISGARGGLDKEYATEFDKQRDTLVLAGKLAELQDLTGGQLTVAEQQLNTAKSQLTVLEDSQAQGRAMLESLSGNVTATLSVAEAIRGLSLSLGKVTELAIYGGSTFSGAPTGSSFDSGTLARARAVKKAWGKGDMSDEDFVFWARANNVPQFAVGTNYVPHDMLAQIHEGEAIVPKAYNPAAGGTQSNARLEALIEGLTSRVQALQSELAAIKTNTGQMAENLDNVTEGGNAMRVA